MIKILRAEWKTKAQSMAVFILATAGLAWIGAESSDYVHALPDWLEVPAYAALTALAGYLTGYVAKHRPETMSRSALIALRKSRL